MLRAFERISHWLGARRVRAHSPEPGPRRGQVDHVVILDGTMSKLDPGMETNAGLTYRLLFESGPSSRLSLFYESGIQWDSWRRSSDVIRGRGINRQIRRAYGFLATRYRPGDRIFLFGYSRGAFAVRSLAGIIDQVGLLRREHATERNVLQAYRHYQARVPHDAARTFSRLYCHPSIEIEMVGVWDTVKALGLRLPLLWRLSEQEHDFHNHHLGPAIRRGYHALALHETRVAFAPVLWTCPPDWQGNVEQVWFRGAHGDVGGQLGGFAPARPLANIPLVWMLERAQVCGLPLPENWRDRFPCDPYAPMLGTMRGLGKLFVLRAGRKVGSDRSEAIHPSAAMVDPKAALRVPASAS
jgi:uncharacterized protein (DUF2235 family)